MYSTVDYSFSHSIIKPQNAFFNSVLDNHSVSGTINLRPIINNQNNNNIVEAVSLGILYFIARPLVLPVWLFDASRRLQPPIIVS